MEKMIDSFAERSGHNTDASGKKSDTKKEDKKRTKEKKEN
jgi:hypothetical protein